MNEIGKEEFAAYVALDWADEKDAFALQSGSGGSLEEGIIKQAPESLKDWVLKLRGRFAEGRSRSLLNSPEED